jgi:hypothetical protein
MTKPLRNAMFVIAEVAVIQLAAVFAEMITEQRRREAVKKINSGENNGNKLFRKSVSKSKPQEQAGRLRLVTD